MDKIWRQILIQDQQIAAGNFNAPTFVLGNTIDPNTRISENQALHGHLVLHER